MATTVGLPDGYGDRRMRVDAEGVFLEWGAELEGVFGYSEAEVVGRKVDLLIPPMLRSKHWEGFNKAMASGRMRRPDIVFRGAGVHKDGHLVPFRSIDILDFDDNATCVGVTAVILRTGWRSYLRRWTVSRSEPATV